MREAQTPPARDTIGGNVNTSTDAVVIGAGVIGAAIALELADLATPP